MSFTVNVVPSMGRARYPPQNAAGPDLFTNKQHWLVAFAMIARLRNVRLVKCSRIALTAYADYTAFSSPRDQGPRWQGGCLVHGRAREA
jgi:hypothetical protein